MLRFRRSKEKESVHSNLYNLSESDFQKVKEQRDDNFPERSKLNVRLLRSMCIEYFELPTKEPNRLDSLQELIAVIEEKFAGSRAWPIPAAVVHSALSARYAYRKENQIEYLEPTSGMKEELKQNISHALAVTRADSQSEFKYVPRRSRAGSEEEPLFQRRTLANRHPRIKDPSIEDSSRSF
jgi:hypothetical protein